MILTHIIFSIALISLGYIIGVVDWDLKQMSKPKDKKKPEKYTVTQKTLIKQIEEFNKSLDR